MKKIFFGVLLVIIFATGLFFWRADYLSKKKQITINRVESVSVGKAMDDKNETVNVSNINNSQIKNAETKTTNQLRLISVPFTSQAPFGDWSDERFQNGCEEASVIMAMKWVNGESFSSPKEAKQKIFDIARFEEKIFGNFIDASVDDVSKIFLQYYEFDNFSIKRNFVLADIKSELAKGNIVIVPAYGRALKNPNYTSPGPITHMLVLVGYNEEAKKFITNDPGTRKGEGYEYDENILFNAIWDYPSGKVHPMSPASTEEKAMIIVHRD